MPKFKIKWEVGNYGEIEDEVEARDLAEAEDMAYEAVMAEVQSLISYTAEEIEEEIKS